MVRSSPIGLPSRNRHRARHKALGFSSLKGAWRVAHRRPFSPASEFCPRFHWQISASAGWGLRCYRDWLVYRVKLRNPVLSFHRLPLLPWCLLFRSLLVPSTIVSSTPVTMQPRRQFGIFPGNNIGTFFAGSPRIVAAPRHTVDQPLAAVQS